MSSNPRDTQFKKFADLLFDELFVDGDTWVDTINSYWKEEWKETIARRAYDLVVHTLSNTSHIDLDRLSEEEHAARIPDMVEWPS